MNLLEIFVVFYVLVCEIRGETPNFNEMVQALSDQLNASNSSEDLPPLECNEVRGFIGINEVTAVSQKEQSLSLDVYLETYWTDYRLDNINISHFFTVPDKYLKKLWIPDIGFSNARGGLVHQVTEENRDLKLGPNGSVHMTTRVTIELYCPMNFTLYPMDTQLCELQLQSWRYNVDVVELKWEGKGFSIDDKMPVPQYDVLIKTTDQLYDPEPYRCVEKYDALGNRNYSCLELNFVLRRQLNFYGLDIYLPSALIVLISLTALFIDHNIVPARVTTGSLSMTAMTNIVRSFQQNTPPVSYTKASDVWIWTCQALVFAVFLEFGVVNFCNRHYPAFKNPKDNFLLRSSPAKTIDKVSRIGFPAVFLLFNLCYWSYFLSASKYHLCLHDIADGLLTTSKLESSKLIPG